MKILFCSDGSTQAESAVRFGAFIAAACDAEATILGIAEKPGDEDALISALRQGQEILKEHGVESELITKAGKPVQEIFKRTRETNYDLLVIGAVRKTTKDPFWSSLDPTWMSARAYRIIESVEPPVLVVIGERPALRRILLCTGGALYIDKAIKFAGEIARKLNAVVDVFHVMPEPPAMYADLIQLEEDSERILTSQSRLGRTLRRHKELLEEMGILGEMRLRHGDFMPQLLKELQRTEYDLLISGSSPAEGFRRYVMGDVTREIVNQAELPVMIIRTGQGKIKHFFKQIIDSVRRKPKEIELPAEAEPVEGPETGAGPS